MTTYQHSLAITDGEYIALKDALQLMIEHCEKQLAAGEGAPFWAHRQSCNNLLRKLQSARPQMTSTNNFPDD